MIEGQWWYNQHMSEEDTEVHIFPKGISLKVNVLTRLEFELTMILQPSTLATTPWGLRPKYESRIHVLVYIYIYIYIYVYVPFFYQLSPSLKWICIWHPTRTERGTRPFYCEEPHTNRDPCAAALKYSWPHQQSSFRAP